MFSQLLATVSLVLAISSQVHAHGGVQPFLGVTGTLAKSDISRLNAASPCGANIDVASSLDSATAVAAAADGTFAVTGVTFDTGSDGSESVKANVDATGAGTDFTTPVTITTNGDPAPATTSVTSPIQATLPSGTVCTGGAAKNLCVVQFVTSAGFANCVAVSQGAATGAAAGNSTATAATGANSTAAAGTAATGANSTAAAAGTAANSTAAAGTAAAGTAAAAKGAKKAGKKANATAGGATAKAGAAAKAAKKAAKAAKAAAAGEFFWFAFLYNVSHP
ncbi:hypothetical protein DFH06DRAFT_1089592 [Mycena polygramma]|nr:hypothetical protein DFH06DRAFT_1089592 [Mycena polygramma]